MAYTNNKIKPENLVGRQVYFKLSKKESSPRASVQPNKLYTTVSLSNYTTPQIISDLTGRDIAILIGKDARCAFLADTKAHWILKRRAS